MKKILTSALLVCLSLAAWGKTALQPVDYVSTLVGTESKYSLSTGNTYPAVAMPWGMNFWVPQTSKNGDGWTYTYSADKICGFKDRKSTRLNSSHANISYAVFCLKKKKHRCCNSHILSYIIFCFLIMRRPPRSTLFPNTTLFRSVRHGVEIFAVDGQHLSRRSHALGHEFLGSANVKERRWLDIYLQCRQDLWL